MALWICDHGDALQIPSLQVKPLKKSYIDQLYFHLQVTENGIEPYGLPLQQPEPITEEPGHNVLNAGFNHPKVDDKNVEHSKDTKNGVKDNAEEKNKNANEL